MPPSTLLASTWTPTPIRGDVTALAARGMRAVVALRSGEVWGSSDGGVRWHLLPSLPERLTVTAALVSPETVIVGTAGRGVLWMDEAGHWRRGTLSERTVLTLDQLRTTVLAGTLRAGVFRSTDRGRSWTAANAGLPLHGEQLEVAQVAATASGWVALHAFGASHSPDGDRWAPLVAGLPMHREPAAVAVLGPDVYAEVGARLYRLGPDDRWDATGIANPIRLVGEAAGALLAALHGGPTLGRSMDAGHTWDGFQDGLPTAELITAVGTTRRAVLVALDGSGLWSRALPPVPDAARPAVSPFSHAALLRNDPNPFADATAISFRLSTDAEITLTVHDVYNEEVSRLAEDAFPAGLHRVVFEAGTLPVGLYQCRLTAEGRTHERTMLLHR